MKTVQVFGKPLPILSETELEKRAEVLADAFDYERISKAMRAVGWLWAGETPTPVSMRSTVRRLVARALNSPPSPVEMTWGGGGFKVTRAPSGEISAVFILSHVGEQRDEEGLVVVPEVGKR
jgi:hypothetical protein